MSRPRNRTLPLGEMDRLPDLSLLGESDNRALRECYRKFLKSAIPRLTARQQEILQLYYLEGYTIPQIASLLGRNRSTISRSLKSSKAKLRSWAELLNLSIGR